MLSPALIQAGYQAEDFGWKTSNAGAGPHGAIAETALLAPSERLMWVRPSEDAPLSVDAAAYYVQGFGTIGDEPAFVTDPEVLDSGQTAAGILYFLLLPSLILLTSGVRARSDVRIQRMQFMAKIGIADRKIRSVLGLETGVLALIGASAGTLLYTVFSPLLGKIPGTRLELAPGSLIPTWWMGPCVVLVVTVVATLLGGMGRLRPRRGRFQRSRPRGIPAVLLVCALGVAAVTGNGFDLLGSVLSSAQGLGTVTFLIASCAAVALTPLSVPYFTYLLSSRLAATNHPPLWAAAKRIASDPIRCSRLSAALAGLIVIVGVAASAWTASGAPNVEGPEQQTAPHTVSLSWVDPRQDAFSRFEEKLHAAPGEPFALEIVEISDAEGEPTANKVRAPECEAAAAFFKASANRLCGDDNAAALNSLVLTHTGYEVASPDEVAAGTGGPVRDAIVVSQAGRDVAEIQRVLGSLTAISIEHTEADITALLPLQLWVAAGIGMPLIPLAGAIAREIGDESQTDAERDAHYLRLGLSMRQVNRISWITLALPVAVAAVISTAVAAIIAYSGQPMRLTDGDLLQLTVILVVAIGFAVASLLVVWPARRSAQRK